MKTIEYDGRKFWQVSDKSAIRCHKADRMEVLTFAENGEILYKSRTVPPYLYNNVKEMFQREGIA